jgi:hypothetical protein
MTSSMIHSKSAISGMLYPDKVSELRSALVHSVLRFSHMIAVGDYFLTRPPPPPEEYY